MTTIVEPRRRVMAAVAAGVGLWVAGCRGEKAEQAGKGAKDVGPTEDLMREHGVIRRVMGVYGECAARLRSGTPLPAEPVRKAAALFRTFGEDYHERMEEEHLFPDLERAGGPNAGYARTLASQHRRGREITDYVLAVAQRPIGPGAAAPLATVLDGFVRMYALHAAFEDTVVFPAWKAALSPEQLDQRGDLFEDLERKLLGTGGFEDSVAEIATIEKSLGIDLEALTAPPPPKA